MRQQARLAEPLTNPFMFGLANVNMRFFLFQSIGCCCEYNGLFSKKKEYNGLK